MNQKCFIVSVFLFCFSCSAVLAVEISPVFSARLLGGQYFFETEESNLSGALSVLAAPALEWNEKWSTIPTLYLSWRGTKSVEDLVGGGTLFQQTQDHYGTVKTIFSPNETWLFKLGGGYHLQLLRETADENWGQGLYDYEKPSGQFEVEYLFTEKTSIRGGYNFYLITFRNYSTLESESDLARENVGAKTLNTINHSPYAAFKLAFPFFMQQKAHLETAYFYTLRPYVEQKIVLASGELSNQFREDTNHFISSTLTLPFVLSETFKILSDVHGSLSILDSNQNNYDASKTQFNPHYYSYTDHSGGLNLNFILGKKPYILTCGFNYVRRDYLDRPIQDVSGTYGLERIHINEYYASFGMSYSVSRNFRLQATSNLGWSRSNMKYEQTYQYSYETFTYLTGVVWDY
jgi:hypothetical protein